MPKLHLFNPDNDLALASGLAHYTPPQQAFRLRIAGEMLPLWMADSGDRIVCRGVNNQWFEGVCTDFNINNIDIFDHTPTAELTPRPWGWSAAARTLFSDAGCSPEMLPDDKAIGRMRELSHRRTAASLAAMLAEDGRMAAIMLQAGYNLAPAAIEVRTQAEAMAAIAALNGNAILKMPWSGSGRGVFDTTIMNPAHMGRIAAQTINTQGSAMIEPRYCDANDFALLMECRDGRCQLWGYSTFATSADGRYLWNRLIEKQRHEQLLSELVRFDIKTVGEIVSEKLTEIIGNDYTGFLGVDMLTGRDSNGNAVFDASVEVNLRCTMGVVAQQLAQRHVHPETLAKGKTVLQIMARNGMTTDEAQYTTIDNRFAGGLLRLVPENPHFEFLVHDGLQNN